MSWYLSPTDLLSTIASAMSSKPALPTWRNAARTRTPRTSNTLAMLACHCSAGTPLSASESTPTMSPSSRSRPWSSRKDFIVRPNFRSSASASAAGATILSKNVFSAVPASSPVIMAPASTASPWLIEKSDWSNIAPVAPIWPNASTICAMLASDESAAADRVSTVSCAVVPNARIETFINTAAVSMSTPATLANCTAALAAPFSVSSTVMPAFTSDVNAAATSSGAAPSDRESRIASARTAASCRGVRLAVAAWSSSNRSWNVAAALAARTIGKPIAAPAIAMPVPARWSALTVAANRACTFDRPGPSGPSSTPNSTWARPARMAEGSLTAHLRGSIPACRR